MKKLKEGHVRTRVYTCTFPLLKNCMNCMEFYLVLLRATEATNNFSFSLSLKHHVKSVVPLKTNIS